MDIKLQSFTSSKVQQKSPSNSQFLLNLPFSTKGGNKKTFKILKEDELNKISQKKGKGILNFLKKMMTNQKQNEQNKKQQNYQKNQNSILYTKASTTKEYYQNIDKKK
jgi:hypothetical protein